MKTTQPSPPTKRRRWRLTQTTIDLGNARHRRNLFIGFVILTVVGIAFLIGGYKAYVYTESAEFCGTACHPMDPQFTRFQSSPHANVACAKCHIGPGASFFVRSKIDGIRQIYAVLANTYSRPIPSPVHNLRPARETCEECHSPTSFKDNIIKNILHYDSDEANTPVMSTLILKMGGWEEQTSTSQGIHWHINNEVYYITADDERQVMLWVGVRQPDGSLKEFFARDMLNVARKSFVEQAMENGRVRQMDCIDCHNRTAHLIRKPERIVDEAIAAGRISQDLPFIRAKAIEVLSPSYTSRGDAVESIEGLLDFYRVAYPATLDNQRQELDQAIETIKALYDQSSFPEMGLNWETYPNNEKHSPTLGCFRCHDDKHILVDESGNEVESISVKCNLCHTVPIVGRGDELLVEAPVITGSAPESHTDFRWTVEHRSITEEEEQECNDCHGRAFCNNGACHNLSHPPDMLYTHADEYRKQGDQVCYTCHQDILCTRCHPSGTGYTNTSSEKES